ncbi:cis-Golgi t-SNARE syntaxin [Apiotrichum porosum]|uniref:Cis-Golgi t-SNARE syntaxin n=1 Tax=Apiotrichum porosum TaxID=105984 RepID=A0A427XM30_9TREE|nr:cis-Golgi t-SNARE syntaxin [Apiotrichum porosum]RSH79920.1 cis-Golgi t-SNARE syntaxin [Apiotrichum porosum]
MAPRDRTAEFHSALSSIRARTAVPSGKRDGAKSPLLGGANAAASTSKSEFGRLAGNIAKDINATTLKLQKLAQQLLPYASLAALAPMKCASLPPPPPPPPPPVAKRKTLFDDRPVEISELTYIIRQDIASLNTQIGALQAFVRAQRQPSGGTKQVDEHNSNVVMMLQSRLANMGMGFKDVLELRTQNMKASKDRTEQFVHTASSAAVPAPAKEGGGPGSFPANSHSNPTSHHPPPSLLRHRSRLTLAPDSLLFAQGGGPGSGIDRKGKQRAVPGEGNDYLALDIDGDRQTNDYQQMQLVEQQDNYIQSRSTAIESIESTIAELGSIFSQLAGMVAEQRETVQRIDADVNDISSNVSGAQRELLKYYANISSNRWLMLKIFGVLIIFFLVFILVS